MATDVGKFSPAGKSIRINVRTVSALVSGPGDGSEPTSNVGERALDAGAERAGGRQHDHRQQSHDQGVFQRHDGTVVDLQSRPGHRALDHRSVHRVLRRFRAAVRGAPDAPVRPPDHLGLTGLKPLQPRQRLPIPAADPRGAVPRGATRHGDQRIVRLRLMAEADDDLE